MKRIAVVGVTGAGKSTLAEKIAGRLEMPHIELDALHWGPNWSPPESRELFRQRVAEALDAPRWVTSGNYSSARAVIWSRADTLVWLDYSLALSMRRLFQRSVRRIVRQEELWGGNRETWRAQFWSRDSLFVWAFKSYPRYKREFPMLLEQEEYKHLVVRRFTRPQEMDVWFEGLETNDGA